MLCLLYFRERGDEEEGENDNQMQIKSGRKSGSAALQVCCKIKNVEKDLVPRTRIFSCLVTFKCYSFFYISCNVTTNIFLTSLLYFFCLPLTFSFVPFICLGCTLHNVYHLALYKAYTNSGNVMRHSSYICVSFCPRIRQCNPFKKSLLQYHYMQFILHIVDTYF
jgi:hypothetical protein